MNLCCNRSMNKASAKLVGSRYRTSIAYLFVSSLWLCSKQSDGFSPPSLSSSRLGLTNEKRSFSSASNNLLMAFEPLPSPGVSHIEPKTKIIEKQVYDEPDEKEEADGSTNVMLAEVVEKEIDETSNEKDVTTHNPQPIVLQSLAKFLHFVEENHRAIVLTALVAAASFLSPQKAVAASSGGRMGGSFSSQRQNTVRTMPRTSSYGGGISRRSYISTGPSVYVNPYPSPFVSPYTPFFGSPFYGYGRPGVIVQTRGPGLLSFLVFGAVAIALTGVVSNLGSSMATTASSVFDDTRGTVSSALGPGVSVVQMSVAMEVPNRNNPNSILSVLDRLANTARTDSRVGLSNLSSQVALELLRRKSSIVGASTKYNHYKERTRAQQQFNNIAIKERGKFERETKSLYGGVDYSPERSPARDAASSATMAVVTLIIAIEGDATKVPKIRSMSDVEEALRTIASDTKVDNCLQSAEILWTPEEKTDTLSKRDVAADYPEVLNV